MSVHSRTNSDAAITAAPIGGALGRLADAAAAYGDEQLRWRRVISAWKRGDPSPVWDRTHEHELLSAARAYATATRKRRTRALSDHTGSAIGAPGCTSIPTTQPQKEEG